MEYCCNELKEAESNDFLFRSYEGIWSIEKHGYDFQDEELLPISFCPFCSKKIKV